MSKRKHDSLFSFSCLGGDASIDLKKIMSMSFEPPRVVFNPEEPELWPVQINYKDGQSQVYYFDSEDSVLEFESDIRRHTV
jgi:hypothetical protein